VEALEAPVAESPVGLSSRAAELLLKRFGPNEPARHRPISAIRQLASSFANPLLAILLVAAVASALLGEKANAAIVAAMVVLSGIIDFVQTFRSARAVEHLRGRVAPTATAFRDGRWAEIPRRTIVPGDRIRLAAGDLVPADARLVRASGLHMVEAALTGESLPVEKEVGGGELPGGGVSPGWLYTGTSVASGSAEAKVERTGPGTRFGEIAAHLAERAPETEFERGIREFGLFITRTILFLVLFILVVSVAMHRPALQSVLFAVALAVGLTPEFLPMISTVTLAQGAVRMARAKVIVKHLPAIQNLGSIDVLCSDKTGTITRGEMSLHSAVDGEGRPWPSALSLAGANSALQHGLVSPLDVAILRAYPDVEPVRRVDEVPFDFERRRVSVVIERGSQLDLVTKGAPESVLAVCSSWTSRGAQRALDEAGQATCRATMEAFTSRGLRVLAVAHRPMSGDEECSIAAERDLCLEGFLAFVDPVLPGVEQTIRALARDGVQVKIITGDDPLVARHVCGGLGLDVGSIVIGSEVERLTDPALSSIVDRTAVFARISPQQKTRILQALRHRGHVVGFLGDGINDAPSLHLADVGISVAHAVDVARDAADIVLLEPGLDVLHAGIVEGRKSFGNVMKYLLMGTSSNFGNMFSMAGAALLLPFLPMLPTQILLNNFLYDLAQVTIPTDSVDESYLARPQRWDIRLVRRFMLVIGPISSLYDFLTFWVLLVVFHASEELFHTGWFLESLATQVLVVFVIRTTASPWRSRPSLPLALTVMGVVLVATILPWTPIAPALGFVPLPWSYFAFLTAATATYLFLVQWAKTRILPKFVAAGPSERSGYA